MLIFVKLSIVDTCRGHDYAFGYPCKIRPLNFVFLANFWNIEKDKWMSSKWIFLESLELLWSILASEMCLWVVFFEEVLEVTQKFMSTIKISGWLCRSCPGSFFEDYEQILHIF